MYVLGLGSAGDSRADHNTAAERASRFPIAVAAKPSRFKRLEVVGGLVRTGNLRQIFTAAVNCGQDPIDKAPSCRGSPAPAPPFGAPNGKRRRPWPGSPHHVFHDVHDYIRAAVVDN